VPLDAESNPIEVLPQPDILKPDTGIRIGLRRGFGDQGLDRVELMHDPSQGRPLTVRIGRDKLNRQCSA